MSTPIETANLGAAFSEIMRSKHLNPEEVQKSGTRIHIFNTGGFDCPCGRSWKSSFSWITFDLKEMKIFKRWKMLCKHCYTECFPTFEMSQLKEMYERAVTSYMKPKSEAVVNIGYGARRKSNQPHLPELCEKCGWGKEICWRRFVYYAY